MRVVRAVLLAVAAFAAVPGAASAESNPTDLDALLRGVTAVELPGVPGVVSVFGPDAFAVLTGDAKRPEAVIGAARLGKGRVVAFAHDGYVSAAIAAKGEGAGRLLRNALGWAGAHGGARARKLKVGVIGGRAPLVAALRDAGFDAAAHPVLAGSDAQDAVLVASADAATSLLGDLEEFVRAGGGLVCGVCPWGWMQVHGDAPIRTALPLNGLLAEAGLVFADGTPDATENGRYAVAKSAPAGVHAGDALASLESGAKDAANRTHILERALRSVPPGDTLFLPRARRAAAKVVASEYPRPSKPLRGKDSLARLAVTLQSVAWRDLVPEDVRAAPGAEEFPGRPDPEAPRGPFDVALAPDPPGWRSTGLYAGPGELVTITVKAAMPDRAAAPRWRVRVGCHTDRLWDLDSWSRWPEITHVVPLSPGTTRVATPWGGPLYFEPLDGAQQTWVTVQGAVEAPIFRAGDPDPAAATTAWAARRRAGAPWAEIVGFRLALSLPSAAVRDLGDPAAVAAWWDEVRGSHCDLTGEPVSARLERFVCDTQISAGYMHSGYPVMMHLDVGTPSKAGPALLVDVGRMRREGAWGPFHELGHNLQAPAWTFEGTGEVTCNLFSLWTTERLCGVAAWDNPWLAGQKANAEAYLAQPDFARWKRDPGIALVTYAGVVRAFGWEPFRTALAEYRTWPAAALPKADDQKIDHFVLRLSVAAKRDLRPWFLRWGWPLSAAARSDAAVGALPAWDGR